MELKDSELILPEEDELSNKDVVSFYNSFDELLHIIENNSTFTKDMSKLISKGKKVIYNKSVRETKEFETAFLSTLEAAYPAFSKIAKNPKSSIKYEEEIVLVEKARKINSQSVKHLSSHSQLVREVTDDNVIPSKILTTFADEDIAIYENRVYKTLVNKIIRFLTRREDQLEDSIEASRVDEITYDNEIEISENDKIEIGLSIKVKKGLNEDHSTAEDILHRTSALLTAYKSLKSTPFMKKLASAKDVYPPLMKTNIILHNADFKIVYNTWIFMERFSAVTYQVGVHDVDFTEDPKVESKLDDISLVLLNTLMYHRQTKFSGSESEELVGEKTELAKLRHDLELKSGTLEGDDYTFSEIFLDEARKLFEEEYQNKLSQDTSKEVSMREAVRKMLKIVDQIGPATFNYKDDDLDEIGKDITVLIKEAEDRYNALKVYREEKEINLAKNKEAEEAALKHLNDLRSRFKIMEDQASFDETREDIEARKKEEAEEAARKAEAEKAQEELRLRQEEELKRQALEKEAKVKTYGFHSRGHHETLEHIRKSLRHFDLTSDLTLNLYNNEPRLSFKSRRDYSDSIFMTKEELEDKIYQEQLEQKARDKAKEDEFFKAFKTKEKDSNIKQTNKPKNKKDRRKICLDYEESKLIPTDENLDLFLISTRLDINTISSQYKVPTPIVVKPRYISKVVSMKKTRVNSKELSKEEIDSLNKKKVIGKNKKLVQKKTKA